MSNHQLLLHLQRKEKKVKEEKKESKKTIKERRRLGIQSQNERRVYLFRDHLISGDVDLKRVQPEGSPLIFVSKRDFKSTVTNK